MGFPSRRCTILVPTTLSVVHASRSLRGVRQTGPRLDDLLCLCCASIRDHRRRNAEFIE
jgi:hypothetical protein